MRRADVDVDVQTSEPGTAPTPFQPPAPACIWAFISLLLLVITTWMTK